MTASRLFLTTAALFAFGSSTHAATVFSDDFTTLTGTGTIRPLSAGNWAGYIGNSATVPTVVSESTGSNRAGVVSGSNTPLTNYLFAQNQTGAAAGTDYFLYRTAGFTSFAPNAYTDITATWSRNGDSLTTGSFYYLCVQIGTDWYVANTGYNTSTSISFDFDAAQWRNLVLDTTPGTGSLAIGSTTSTFNDRFGAGQQVTGIGFYIDDLAVSGSGARTIRLDNIVIDAVPEPSSLLVAAAGIALPALRRRRK